MFSDVLTEMTIFFGHFKNVSVYDRKKTARANCSIKPSSTVHMSFLFN